VSIPCDASGRIPTAADVAVAEALAEVDAVAVCDAVEVAEAADDALGDGDTSLEGPAGRAIKTTAIRIAATATTPRAIQALR
jgi:hypothetical protein